MNIVSNFGESLSVLKKDKWIVIFSLIPVILGIVFYFFLGSYLYGDLLDSGKQWIESSISSSGWSSFLYYIVAGLLTIGFYFLLSWTFVLVVSGVASPFNDIISNRTERVVLGEVPEDIGDSMSRLFSRLIKTLVNEAKKIGFIILLTLIAFGVSFVPILAPVGLFLSALLMAISFLDYSWSRKNLPFRKCLSDVRGNLLSYGIVGGVFLVLMSIPAINLVMLPFGVIYFTVLYTKNRI